MALLDVPGRGYRRAVPPILCPICPEAIGEGCGAAITSSTPASATWPTANRLIAYPFRLQFPAIARQLWWYNGATASGNVDCAILDASGSRLGSAGSTAQSGTNVLQVVNITDVQLDADVLYFCALCMDNTTGTMFRVSGSNQASVQAAGVLNAAGHGVPIGSSVTLANAGTQFLPFFGIDFRGAM